MKSRRRLLQNKGPSSPSITTHSYLQTRSFGPNNKVDASSMNAVPLRHGQGFNFTNLPIQPKLTIGQPGDKYEQEADQVAHRVVQQINSHQGQELLAPELTHVVQQNPGVISRQAMTRQDSHLQEPVIQRLITQQSEEGETQYYSHPMPGQEITQDQGVITVSTSDQDNGRGGHSTLFFEYWDADTQRPKSLRSDMVLQSGSKSKINVRIGDGAESAEHCASLSNKRSWVATTGQIEAGIEKAEDVQANSSDYTYAFMGFGLTKKKPINCARFAEKVLKASGIKATAGLIVKTPYELATGSKTKKKKKKEKEEREPENVEVQEETPLPEIIQEIDLPPMDFCLDDKGQVGDEVRGGIRGGTHVGITAGRQTKDNETYILAVMNNKTLWLKAERLAHLILDAEPEPSQANVGELVNDDQ